jgi:hypothetical protein
VQSRDIIEVLSNGDEENEELEDEENGTIQSTFDYFARIRKQALDHVMDRVNELLAIDNETLSDVKSMEEIYSEIRADPLYQRLFSMASVHTAEQFGLDIPEDADEQMARAIEDENDWTEIEEQDWFRAAQATNDEERFFHWDLEFPEVFFDADGGRMESAGFDAVMGNPPYGDILSASVKKYCRSQNLGFESERADIFTAFVSLPETILRKNGRLGYIVPNTPLRGKQYEKFRETNSERYSISMIADFDRTQIFSVEVYTMVLICENRTRDAGYSSNYIDVSDGMDETESIPVELTPATTDIWVPSNPLASKIMGSNNTVHLGDGTICTCHDAGIDYKVSGQGWENRGEGVKISDLILYEGNPESEKDLRYISGGEIQQYSITPKDKWLRYDYESFIEGDIVIQVYPEYNESEEKIVTRQTADDIIAALDTDQLYTAKSVHTTLLQNESYDIRYILALLNSKVTNYVYESISGEEGRTFAQVRVHELRSLPIRAIDFEKSKKRLSMAEFEQEYESMILSGGPNFNSFNIGENSVLHDLLVFLSRKIEDYKTSRNHPYLPDYLGNYADGMTLMELGYDPPAGLGDSLLAQDMAEIDEFENVQAREAYVEREGNHVTVFLAPYVKQTGNEDGEYETLDPIPAMQFTDLSESQASLLEAFVPYAVEESTAGYSEKTTKTISLLDRLEDLTLPVLSDVENGIESYIEERKRAEELDQKIERTDDLIDEIVYELYGLTDEEIQTVEDAVDD